MPAVGVEVFIDDTCGFSDRASHCLDTETDADWRPFSLLETDRDDDGPPVSVCTCGAPPGASNGGRGAA